MQSNGVKVFCCIGNNWFIARDNDNEIALFTNEQQSLILDIPLGYSLEVAKYGHVWPVAFVLSIVVGHLEDKYYQALTDFSLIMKESIWPSAALGIWYPPYHINYLIKVYHHHAD
jgi:hypothetical protein